MKKSLLKSVVGITIFALGIFTVANWLIYPFSLTPNFDVQIPNAIEVEESEKYAVYSAVLKDSFVKNESSPEPLTISNETSFYENADYLKETPFEERIQDFKKYYPSVSEETFVNYESKQVSPSEIRPRFNIPVEYVLVDAKKIKESEGYAAVGMVKLSQVGFNRDKTQAFVYIEYFCPLCGFGNYILLEKENGNWKVKETFGGWVS